MNRTDFYDWKRHPVTIQVFSRLSARHDELLETLVEQSIYGDPRKLAETAAAIKVYREVLNLEVDDEESNGN